MARAALTLAQKALPAHSSQFSRQDFFQHRLFAMLAWKTFFKTDDHGVVAFCDDFTAFRDDLGLKKVPPILTSAKPHRGS